LLLEPGEIIELAAQICAAGSSTFNAELPDF
jgi:hypothetical protein